MKKLLLLFLALCVSSTAFSQKTRGFAQNSEAEASKLLEKVRNKYESYGAIKGNFTLVMKNEGGKETFEGTVMQKGESFRVETKDNIMISDGSTVWAYMRKRNEVQISNVDPSDDSFMSPDKMLRIYEKKEDFEYFFTGETIVNGVRVYQIEFKPTDRSSEYAKMRISINKMNSDLEQVKVFAKDGTRYTLDVDLKNESVSNSAFTFERSKFPGVSVIDSRID